MRSKADKILLLTSNILPCIFGIIPLHVVLLGKMGRYIIYCNFSGKVISMVNIGNATNKLLWVNIFVILLQYSRKPFGPLSVLLGLDNLILNHDQEEEIYIHNFYKTVISSCCRLHNKAPYPPINLKHLTEIRSIYWT